MSEAKIADMARSFEFNDIPVGYFMELGFMVTNADLLIVSTTVMVPHEFHITNDGESIISQN